MTAVRWTRQAVSDLQAIHEFIRRDSAAYASATVERLFLAAQQLTHFPDSGRVVPERGNVDIRELVRPPYRIVYRYRPDLVEILTVHHSARRIPGNLPGDSRQGATEV